MQNQTETTNSLAGNKSDEFYLTSSIMAAKLHRIPEVARGISLEAMNASALTARLGVQGASFRPLTQFMSEVAKKTATLIDQIETIAVKLSRAAIDDLVLDMTNARVARAYQLGAGHPYLESITPVADKLKDGQLEVREAITRHQQELRGLLNEIADNMKAARLASKSTRFEAAQLIRHRGVLESIARAMEEIVTEIEEIADASEELLITGFARYKRETENHER
jgi:hypothetical protein